MVKSNALEFSSEAAISILKKYWGYTSFRSPQEKIIASILSGKDTFALLPTGGGKSICYQLPAMLSEGKVVVISPLVSLMLDQVKSLEKRGIKAKAIHSGLSTEEVDIILDNFVHGPLKLLYISPERIASEVFQVRFYMARIAFIAVDEAHCISQWGHDFRPSYLQISLLRELKPDVPVLALTATATPAIVEDVAKQLFLKEHQLFQNSFSRDNISFSVVKTDDKNGELLRILMRMKGTAIVYNRSRSGCAKIAALLKENNISSTIYHAGLHHEVREDNQKKWMDGKVRVMVATNAFGMGIDKSDVRCVIHVDVPSGIEDYYQEAGRAGRDGLKSFAIALINASDIIEAQKLFEINFPGLDEIKNIYLRLCQFLGIATASGSGRSFFLDTDEFSQKHKISQQKLNAVLKILEKQGWLTYSDSIKSPSRLMVIGRPQDLLGHYPEKDLRGLLLTQLLRMYEGLTLEYGVVSISRIAKSLDTDASRIGFLLKVLHQEGMIDYQPSQEFPEIMMLLDRPMDGDFRLDENAYQALKNNASKRLMAMQEYFLAPHCRQQMLLEYFGEKAAPCGVCDVCLGSQEIEYTIDDKRQLMMFLQKTKSGTKIGQVLSFWPYNKRKRLGHCIEDLAQEDFLEIDAAGRLYFKKM